MNRWKVASISSMCGVGSEWRLWQRFLKSGRIHKWINYSWLTGSFSTLCLTGPAVRVFLVSRNRCVPGRLLNSVLGAEGKQLWQCGNNYQPSLLSPSLIRVQWNTLLVGVSLTHGESLKNPLHLSFICQTWHRIEGFAIYFFFFKSPKSLFKTMDPNHSAFRKWSFHVMSIIQTSCCIWLIFLHSSLNESALQWLLQQHWMSLRKA